jgi:hypothetical protein
MKRLLFTVLSLVVVLIPVYALSLAQNAAVNQPAPGPAPDGFGLMRKAPGAFEGYTLISPLTSTSTFLVDMEGRIVHTWETGSAPGAYAVLLENGNLLRAGLQPNHPYGGFVAGGGGKIQEFAWNGELVWDYTYVTDKMIPHHDFLKLPNGNVLLVIKEKKTPEEAIAAGRIPSSVPNGTIDPDALIELRPTGKTTAEVVWEWHLWDHLIQDVDPARANYGDVAARPERMDINFGVNPGQRGSPDWAHVNAVAYNPELDQIAISLRSFNEIFVLDHSTTTKAAAGSTGGKSGKGGDILYRWGNPRAYRRGTAEDQRSFGQHNVHWIAKGLPGAGNLLIFNNGDTRTGERFSTVDEFVPPVDANGRYTLEAGKKYGPEQALWTYAAPNRADFYSNYISGAQRLPNGNTLICAGATGMVFEVTPQKQVVWQYNFPAFGAAAGGPARGAAPTAPAAPPGPGARGGARGARGGGANNPRAIFRAYRYGPDFPGLAGKTLTPGRRIEEAAQ